MLELSPRLRAIAERIPQGARLADIGTDHAYLPVYLLQTGRISHAIASDLREGPLAHGQAVARQWGIPETAISFRHSDGLRGLQQGEANTFVLAGMGGETIAACLGGVSWSHDAGLRYVLQPMSSVDELRLWLSIHGFCIHKELLLWEGEKRYLILEVTPGNMSPLSPAECWVGRQDREMHSPERTAYLADIIARRERALTGMRQARRKELAAEVVALEALLSELKDMQKEWLSWQG